jgi:hypothetical protein
LFWLSQVGGGIMSIEKKAFVSYTLDEERKEETSKPISLKINKQERALIERLKRYTNYDQDSKVLKIGLIVLEKVILNNFGSDIFSKLTSSERVRNLMEELPEESNFPKK